MNLKSYPNLQKLHKKEKEPKVLEKASKPQEKRNKGEL